MMVRDVGSVQMRSTGGIGKPNGLVVMVMVMDH
jgi:hypothetical protein